MTNARKLFILTMSLSATMIVASCSRTRAVKYEDSRQRGAGMSGVGIEAQPEPYAPPKEVTQRSNGAPAGKLSEPAMFDSFIYNMKFRYRVYVPAQYQPGHPAALMVFQDAKSVYLGLMNTPVVFDNLIHAGEMPVTIALFLDPGSASGEFNQDSDDELRSLEYDTMDDKYSRFLIEEIIPQIIRKRYGIVDDPNGWAIAGQSSGGIAAFTVGWHHPERFRKILTHNGSFTNIRGGNAYPALVRSTEPKPLRVYLLSGTRDLNRPKWGNWFEANKEMAAALGEKGYAYRFRTGTGAHFPPLQAQADFPNALRWLWRGFSLKSYPRKY